MRWRWKRSRRGKNLESPGLFLRQRSSCLVWEIDLLAKFRVAHHQDKMLFLRNWQSGSGGLATAWLREAVLRFPVLKMSTLFLMKWGEREKKALKASLDILATWASEKAVEERHWCPSVHLSLLPRWPLHSLQHLDSQRLGFHMHIRNRKCPQFLLISRLYTRWVEYGYVPKGKMLRGGDWRMRNKKDKNKIWDQEVLHKLMAYVKQVY